MFDSIFPNLPDKIRLDLRAYKGGGAGKLNEVYNLGNGSTATSKRKGNTLYNTYTPSDYEQSQTKFLQSQIPQIQHQLIDQSGINNNATNYADNIKKLGMERFNQDMTDTMNILQQNNANRFGSLSNSSYADTMNRTSQGFGKELADLNTQYDVNKQDNMNAQNNYWNNLLGILQGNAQQQLVNAGNANAGSMSGYNSISQIDKQDNQQNLLNTLWAIRAFGDNGDNNYEK